MSNQRQMKQNYKQYKQNNKFNYQSVSPPKIYRDSPKFIIYSNQRDSSICREVKQQRVLMNLSNRSIGVSLKKLNPSMRSLGFKQVNQGKQSIHDISSSNQKIKFNELQPKRRKNLSKFYDGQSLNNRSLKNKKQSSKNSQNGFIRQLNKLSIKNFNIIKKLGQGSFSQVYQIIDKNSNTLYALKVMDKLGLKQMQGISRITSQLKIQQYCNHTNIIKLYSIFDDEKRICLIQQYSGEKTLYSLMEEKRNSRMQIKQVQAIIKQICQAVRYLHNNNIIHRDIKPENILVAPGGVVKITDFGWSIYNPQKDLRNTFCGTPLYLSPEIICQQKYNQSVDIWAIGILTFELLTGQMPFGIKCCQDLRNVVTEDVNISQIKDNSAKNFVKILLIKQIEKRKGIQEICEHEFLNKIYQF